jgi:cell division septum initiation protein DivIVA
MNIFRAILNDLAVFFNKGLVVEIESLEKEIKKLQKEIKKYTDWNDMTSDYVSKLKTYRDNTIETIRDVYKINKDFYSLMGVEFFDWRKCFDNHWEKRLYDYSPRYTSEDKENLEVKELGDFIIKTYPHLVKKIEKSFKIFKQIIIKLTKKIKQQETRIKYLENLCQSNLIGVN